MREKKILLAICACSLLAGGCSSNQTADPKSSGQADATQTAQVQPTEARDHDDPSTEHKAQASKITEQEALDTALKDAEVKESDLTLKRIEKDFEDGREIYDIEFYTADKEYDYEISVSDGSIIKSEVEKNDDGF